MEVQKIHAILDRYKSLGCVMSRPQSFQSVDKMIYWLQGSPLSLYALDLTASDAGPIAVLQPSAPTRTMTKEEELLRERQRTVLTGINNYLVVDRQTIFFEAHGSLHLFLDGNIIDVFAAEDIHHSLGGSIPTCITHSKTDPFCISFVANYNLYNLLVQVINKVPSNSSFATGGGESLENERVTQRMIKCQLIQLTVLGKEHLECGNADYIMQEEFDRYTGHFWSPNNNYLLYTINDTSMLKEVTLIDQHHCVERMPFPKVGDPNAKSILVVTGWRDSSFYFVPTSAILAKYPWMEYLPRIGWVNDHVIWVMVLSRDQERCAIFQVYLENLVSASSHESSVMDPELHENNVFVHKTFIELWSVHYPGAWMEVNDTIHRLDQVNSNSSDFILGYNDPQLSSSGGHFHLYLLKNNLPPVLEKTDTLNLDAVESPGSTPPPCGTIQPLTAGHYNVIEDTIQIVNGLVFFLAAKEDPLYRSIYYVRCCPQESADSSAGIQSPVLLSPKGYHVSSFQVVQMSSETLTSTSASSSDNVEGMFSILAILTRMDEKPDLYMAGPLATTGAKDSPPKWEKVKGAQWLSVEQEGVLDSTVQPQILRFPNKHGVELSASLFLPKDQNIRKTESGKIPLMMYVYGGPQVQLVHSEAFPVRCRQLDQCIVELGVAVAVVDNQVAHTHGLQDRKITKLKMGQFEIEDYVTAVKFLCEKCPKIDPARIGIYGWSYGGYSSLLAMCQAPDVFRLCFSGAPVGDWRLYDTGYTERYMGLVPKDEEGYNNGSIANYVDGFPDEFNRVFIAHGLTDENVHFAHTCHVIEAMVKANKPYSLQVFPGERHCMRQNPASKRYYDTQMLLSLLRYL